ncbi:branched-chain amino acid ABC transporter permease, partial [Candidatus Peregrinibacteria bacterium]|nr:branched-chain amino acid ABC transporter permease [Candidatus Peregrinibacteria bacterium]
MSYLLTILSLIAVFMILSQSYNLILGYAGMIHVGHVGFMAIGAYTAALLNLEGYSFGIGLLVGVSCAALAGLLLGIPTIRFREDYLVAATLGMGEIIRLIFLNERGITGGSTGITKITRPEIAGFAFQSPLALFLLVAGICFIVQIFVWRLTRSPYGKVLESIREDEIAASALGKNIHMRKLQILVIGALLAGLSGALFAHTLQFIEPEAFNIQRMLLVFLIVVFGGSGTFWGPIVGT